MGTKVQQMDFTDLVCKALGIPTMDPSGKIGAFIGHAVEVLKDSRVAPIVIPTEAKIYGNERNTKL